LGGGGLQNARGKKGKTRNWGGFRGGGRGCNYKVRLNLGGGAVSCPSKQGGGVARERGRKGNRGCTYLMGNENSTKDNKRGKEKRDKWERYRGGRS